MRVLFISANREDINMATLPLGMVLVAEATRAAGHQVELLDLLGQAQPAQAVRQAIAALAPQVIGISVRNIDDQCMARPRFLLDQALTVVQACRQECSAPLVLGGAGYSIFPQSALAYLGADMGIEGEGEEAFVQLLELLAGGGDPAGVPGLHLPGQAPRQSKRLLAGLDRLPWPAALELLGRQAASPELWVPVQTRRGCPLNCVYCSTPAIEGPRLRRCTPQGAAQALAALHQAGARRFFVTDNTFNLPPSHALRFCRALTALNLGLQWRGIIYPSRLSPELVEAMAQSGCLEVSLGFESGSPAMLARLGKRFSLEDVRHDARLLAKHGIRRMGFLLLGGPGETQESVRQSLAFADSLGLEALKLTVGLRVYPGTGLHRLGLAQGLLATDDDLLQPRFYMQPELGDWLPQEVAAWAKERPHWLF